MTELEKQLLDVASSILADDMLPLLPAEYVAKVRSAIAAAEEASPNYPAVPEGWALVKSPITEDMHRAAVKVLVRANGVDGLPQRMLDAMVATAPPATVKDSLIVQQAPAGFRPDQFFAYSHEIGFELLNTAEDARSFAQQEIDEYRDNAAEGWDESVENVRWGVVLGKAEQIPITDHDGNTTDSSGDRFVDYVLSDCAPAQIEQQAPHKWQPIGTAPADGRTILLGHFNSHGNWRTIRGQWFTKEHIEDNWEDGDLFEAGWYETSVEADDAPSCWPTKPTHWQPLPAAPTQEAGARLAAEAKGGSDANH